ncbi:helix loop helix DNA-binding domain protein [Ceratobasidium sp. AG-Ba]|nr:helix loop helix DNA-binding domain protein [Ceratobasidium sp. AG-Ba]
MTDDRGSATPARTTPTQSPRDVEKPRLTSLEYLQLTQRSGRGSITDPSLHVSHQTTSPRPRPPSPLRRSPQADKDRRRLDRDYEREEAADSPGPDLHRPSQALDFNYNMRRHSIATVPRMRPGRDLSPLARSPENALPHQVPFLPPPPLSGQKRKLATDRPFPVPLGPDDAPRFAGAMAPPPGLDQGPALKRRGSAFDPRIGGANMFERRDSVGGAPWLGDRRDSTASIYSNTSIASSIGYTTANSSTYSPDTQLHSGNKPGQVYAWPEPNGNSTQGDLPQRSFPSFSETHANGNGQPFVGANDQSRPPIQPVAVPSLPASTHDGTPETTSQPTVPSSEGGTGPRRDSVSSTAKDTPYSRSPELRVSHKLAERKRRKEMKDLFDELRDHLPADRGMKASKWEILSKAVDYISQLKQSYAEVSHELDLTRHELEALRPGSLAAGTHHHHPAPHHPHPGYGLPYTYPVSGHYPVQPGSALGAPPPGSTQQPPPA